MCICIEYHCEDTVENLDYDFLCGGELELEGLWERNFFSLYSFCIV